MFKKAHMLVASFIAGFTMIFVILLMYASYRHNRTVRRLWCKMTTKLVGISEIVVTGAPDPDAKMFTINHRTLLDIIIVEAVLPRTINPCWIAKKEIAKIPIYGRILDAPKMITIDRENSREMVKLLKMVEEPLAEKRPLMIFPEGTRNKGGGLLKFKAGAKMVASKHNLLVQPVVIKNADLRFNLKNGVTIGKVYLEFLPATNPTHDEWYTKLEEDMSAVYEKLGAE